MIGQLDPVEAAPAVTLLRPRFEGANVGTWIGFKHVMYLVEEGVLQFLRDRGAPPGDLLKDHALEVEIAGSRLRLTNAVEVDDVVRVEVTSKTKRSDQELTFGVVLTREGSGVKLASGTVKAVLRAGEAALGPSRPPPRGLEPYVVREVRRATARANLPAELPLPSGPDPLEARARRALSPEGKSFVWTRRIPYFYCHYTERLQHSGYLRLLEESVELFLEDRGISIATMLRERRWIPVVLSAEVELLREVPMEATLYIAHTVEEILKDLTYKARMDCFLVEGDRLVRTATGTIDHAYLHIEDRGTGSKVMPFDARVREAFLGTSRREP